MVFNIGLRGLPDGEDLVTSEVKLWKSNFNAVRVFRVVDLFDRVGDWYEEASEAVASLRMWTD